MITWKRDDGVDDDGMDGLAVSADEHQRMSLDGDLRRTDGGEGVDHAEPVATTRSDGERL